MLLEHLQKVNNTNRTVEFLLEKEMLDISILNADKVKDKDAFLNDTYRIEEKFDGCLDYNTKIKTKEFGEIEIGKVVDENLDCSVLSYNHSDDILEYKKITARKNSGKSKNWVQITLENNDVIKITDNHWVWSETCNDYVQVKDMKEGEEILLVDMKKAVKIKLIEQIENDSDRYDIEVEDNKNYFADNILVHNTKLTLWRNGEDWNEDYEKNWVVAFKNQILYGEEFESTDREKVKKHSVGISQYAFIHDHMKKIHKDTKSFPKNTEIFVEFIQNKLTTTRDYENKHGLYIIAYSPATGEVEGGMLKTKPTGFFQEKVTKYSKDLNLNLPPVVFEGKLNSVSNITKGIQNPKLKNAWNKYKDEFISNPYETVKKTFLEFESVLGGKTEGVVLHSNKGGIFKFLQTDQHDKDFRFAKKMKYQADKDTETKYWTIINELTQQILNDMNYDFEKLSYQDILKEFSKIVNTMTDSQIEKIFKFKFDAMKREGKMK